ncbi:hypothetical protein L0222_12370 [bacterium]|nr:hypothetical protein [bacterium]MCI0605888.1 hypothetical protein [bacterium]
MQKQRTHFAAGDYLTRYPEGHHYKLRIDAPFEKPGWKSRSFSPTGQSIFPGSAIEFEGSYYEIVFQDYEPGPPLQICYYLNPWEERFPIRLQFHYNKEECRNTARARRNQIKSNRQNVLLTLFSPLVGMLPAEDQIRIANRFGISATQMTFFSALILLPPSAFCILFFAANWFGKVPFPGPPSIHWIYPFGFYFFSESLLRMLTASKLDEPVGSLFVSLPILSWRSIRQIFDPNSAQRNLENLRPIDDRQRSLLANARDEVIPAENEAYDLEVLSVLPKNHWNPRIGIGINGAWYGLVETDKIKHGKNIHYRFRLKKAPEGTWFSSVIEYNPDEVQLMYLATRKTDLKTWVDTFAVLWGLLSREDQERLENLYDFDSMKFSRLTIVAIGILAFANLGVSLMNLLTGLGRALDAWLLLLSGFFLFETFSRWKDLRAGQPSGSVLGVFVRPFARKLLQGP